MHEPGFAGAPVEDFESWDDGASAPARRIFRIDGAHVGANQPLTFGCSRLSVIKVVGDGLSGTQVRCLGVADLIAVRVKEAQLNMAWSKVGVVN